MHGRWIITIFVGLIFVACNFNSGPSLPEFDGLYIATDSKYIELHPSKLTRAIGPGLRPASGLTESTISKNMVVVNEQIKFFALVGPYDSNQFKITKRDNINVFLNWTSPPEPFGVEGKNVEIKKKQNSNNSYFIHTSENLNTGEVYLAWCKDTVWPFLLSKPVASQVNDKEVINKKRGAASSLNVGLNYKGDIVTAQSERSMKNRYKARDQLNVRDGPSLAARVVGKVTKGARVGLVSEQERVSDGLTWVEIENNKKTRGWAAKKYLEVERIQYRPADEETRHLPKWLLAIRSNPIAPGTGMGGVMIGDPQEAVLDNLGAPKDGIEPIKFSGKEISSYRAVYEHKNITFVVFMRKEDKKVKWFRLWDNDFNYSGFLPKHNEVTIGTSAYEIINFWGRPNNTVQHLSCPGATDAYLYIYTGIELTVCDNNTLVYMIAIK